MKTLTLILLFYATSCHFVFDSTDQLTASAIQAPLPPAAPKTCTGKTQDDFPAPAPIACLPPQTQNAACVAECKVTYAVEMLEAAEGHCKALKALNATYIEAYQACLTTYSSDLIYCSQTYSGNSQLLSACMGAAHDAFEVCAGQAQTVHNEAVADENESYNETVGYIYLVYLACTRGCCE